jgi:DNA gyrase inhibitor GyrI
MAAVAVDLETWERAVQSGAVDRKTVRRATLTLKPGRYAIFEGFGSVSRVYRAWRRDFDGWLLANGECPRPDQVFVRFPEGTPHTLFEDAKLTLYIPLEPVAERTGTRRREAAKPRTSD